MAKQVTPKEELVQVKSGALSNTAVPEWLSEFKGQSDGFEDMEQSDVSYPRLGLCQALSPQKKKSNPNYIEGLEEGQLFNTITGEIYDHAIEVIPVIFKKQRIWFREMNEGGGILCQSADGHTGGKLSPSCDTCAHSQWSNGKPECGLFLNYYCKINGTSELIVVSFKSTALKVARQWNALTRMTNLPMFAKVYTIGVATLTKNNNEYAQMTIKPKGFVEQEEFKALKELYDNLSTQTLAMDVKGMSEESGNTSFDPKGPDEF